MTTDWSFLDASVPVRFAVDVDAAEGDKLTAYPDTLGNWTIGRGHLLPPAAPGQSWAGFTIIQSTSDRYFNGDLQQAMRTALSWPEFAQCDTDCRKNALREIAFNMSGKWAKFVKARAAMRESNWQGVHDELTNSAADHEEPKRIERIADYFLTGQYPDG